MGYIYHNENPFGLDVGDCVIRAITTALSYNWFMVHDELSFLSRKMADMPSSNRVWKEYLTGKGWKEVVVDNSCPNCFSVKEFCKKHKKGRFILSTCSIESTNNIIVTASHVIAVIDGDYYDTWDSGADVPLSYFYYQK